MSRCVFTLDVEGVPDTATENDVRKFLLSDGCDALMQAFQQTLQLRSDVVTNARGLPRDGSFSFGCSVGSRAGWSCGGTATIRF